MKPIRIKLDVTKLDKERFFRAQSGAVYADLVAWPNDKPGKFGDTHTVRQQTKKGEKVKMPIVGNLTLPDDEPSPAKQTPPRAPQKPAQAAPDPDLDTQGDDIPF